MAVQPIEPKVAVIFAADVAGCRRLMARDGTGTLARLKACRIIISGLMALHRRRISRPEYMAHLPEGLCMAGLSR